MTHATGPSGPMGWLCTSLAFRQVRCCQERERCVTVHTPGRSEGAGWWARWAPTAAVRNQNALRPRWRQASITVSMLSTKRQPLALCVRTRACTRSSHDARHARPRCWSAPPLGTAKTSTATGDVRTSPGMCHAGRDRCFGCRPSSKCSTSRRTGPIRRSSTAQGIFPAR